MPSAPILIAGACLIVLIVWLIVARDRTLARTWGTAAMAVIIAATIFGIFLLQSRQPQTSLRVVGYASKLFDSDLVKWNLTIQNNSQLEQLHTTTLRLNRDVMEFKKFLIQEGIPDSAITILPATSAPVYEYGGRITGYTISQNLMIISSDLDKIEKVALEQDFLAQRGLILASSNLSYLFTKLPELKQELLAEATRDAVSRAYEITGAAGTKPGKLMEARAGVFQITEPYSTEVSDYGIHNTGTRQKSISVTLNALFALK